VANPRHSYQGDKKMAKVLTAKVEGKVIASIVSQFKTLVAGQETAQFEFIKRNKNISVLDLTASLNEAVKYGTIASIRPNYSKVFALAGIVLDRKWKDIPNVAEFMKELEVAYRALGADKARALAGSAKCGSWKAFTTHSRKAEKVKKTARDNKKALTASAEGNAEGDRKPQGVKAHFAEVMADRLVVPANVAEVLTVAMVIEFALVRIESAEDITLTPDEIELAVRLAKKVNAIVKVQKAKNHPATLAKVA
jgi:hypothetical protein